MYCFLISPKLTNLNKPIISLDIHSKSRLLISGGADSVVRVWDLKDKKMLNSWNVHKSNVISVRFSFDDDHLASASSDGIIQIHNLRHGKTVSKLQLDPNIDSDSLKMIQYSKIDKAYLATCSDEGRINIWETSRSKLSTSILAHSAPCTSICFSQNNSSMLISSGLDKLVKIHDFKNPKTASTIPIQFPASALDFLSEGSTICVATSVGYIYIFDYRYTQTPWITIAPVSKNASSIQSIKINQLVSNLQSSSSSYLNKSINTSQFEETTDKLNVFNFLEKSSPLFLKNNSTSNQSSNPSAIFDSPAVSKISLFSPLRNELLISTPNSQTSGFSSSIKPSKSTPNYFSTDPKYDYKKSDFYETLFSPLGVSDLPTNISTNVSTSTPLKSPNFSLDFSSFSPTVTSNDEIAIQINNSIQNENLKLDSSEYKNFKLDSSEYKSKNENLNSPHDPKLSNQENQSTDHNFEWKLVQNVLGDMMEKFENKVQRQILNMHLEMIRQFQIQQNEISQSLELLETNKKLLELVKELQEENFKLKKLF